MEGMAKRDMGTAIRVATIQLGGALVAGFLVTKLLWMFGVGMPIRAIWGYVPMAVIGLALAIRELVLAAWAGRPRAKTGA
jgi:hypothetical protein